MGDLRAAEAERDRLALLGAELRGETQRLGSRLEEAQREHEAARELLEREHGAARERLERLLSAVQADVARAAASRAWRLGHGTALLVARVTLRRPDTESALDRALSRLEAARTEGPASGPTPLWCARDVP
jgi:hypothetical protein